MPEIKNVWEIDESNFPQHRTNEEKAQFLLNYAIMAPSIHNTQPWSFSISDDQVRVFADFKRDLPILDMQHRELLISCGTAIYFLQLAMRYFAVFGEMRLFPDSNKPELLAILKLGKSNTPDDNIKEMFHAITHRHTLRVPYSAQSIPENILESIAAIAASRNLWLRMANFEQKEMLAQLIADADITQYENTNFRQELSHWLRSVKDIKQDGMPIASFGFPSNLDFLSSTMAYLIEHFDIGKMIANHDKALVNKSAQLAVLGTFEDSYIAWLTAGLTLGEILLFATAQGLAHAYENQPCEIKQKRTEIGQILAQAGYPQVILRLGYVDGSDWQRIPHSPRRSVSSVLKG